MGQKIDPRGFRLGVIRDSDSTWFAENGYAELVLEDYRIRNFIAKKLNRAGVSSVKIKRRAKQVEINIYAARPGMIIGKGGADVDALRGDIEKKIGKSVQLNIREEEKPDTNAAVLAEGIAAQLERRMPFRQVMKKAVSQCLKSGAKGIRVCCSGRLAGAEIARREWYREGRLPLHTLRSNIDFSKKTAFTTYGTIGIKVWVYKGDILDKKDQIEGMERLQMDPEIKEDVTT
jgi:small subunit ribosomal protein S3